MRLAVRLYALLIIASVGLVAAADVMAVSSWTHAWTPLAGLALLFLYVLAVHFQFQGTAAGLRMQAPSPRSQLLCCSRLESGC